MRHLLLLLICVSALGYAQPKLAMSPQYSVTPVAAVTQSVGIPYNTTFTVSTWVKNTGNSVFTGNFRLVLAVDSGAGSLVIVDSTIHNGVTINPNDSVPAFDTTTVHPNRFKSGGNGNTIVVWPVSSIAQTVDSIHTKIYIVSTTGINELSYQHLQVYPNPTGDRLYIKGAQAAAGGQASIYDLCMKKVLECGFSEAIDVSALKPGTYWIHTTIGGKVYTTLIVKTD